MSDEIKRKRGRPKTGGDVRSRQFPVLMNEIELDNLGRFSRIAGKSKADFIRDAVNAEIARIEAERAAKFAYLNRDSDDDYGYFEEYEEEFDEDFG